MVYFFASSRPNALPSNSVDDYVIYESCLKSLPVSFSDESKTTTHKVLPENRFIFLTAEVIITQIAQIEMTQTQYYDQLINMSMYH